MEIPRERFKDPWLSAPPSRMVWLCRRTKFIVLHSENLVNQNLKSALKSKTVREHLYDL